MGQEPNRHESSNFPFVMSVTHWYSFPSHTHELISTPPRHVFRYLLQLVQALKYEPLITADGRVEMAAVLGAAALDGAAAPPPPTKAPIRGVSAIDEPEEGMDAGTPVGVGLAPTSLAGFLVKRALEDRRLGSFLYWYLLVECKDKGGASTRLYTRVYSELVHALESGTPDQVRCRLAS